MVCPTDRVRRNGIVKIRWWMARTLSRDGGRKRRVVNRRMCDDPTAPEEASERAFVRVVS